MFVGRRQFGGPDNNSAKGEYESLAQPSSGRRVLGVLLSLGLLAGGLGFMLAHHFFYSFLNEKSIDLTTGELPPVLRDQSKVNFIGTTIAHGARAVFSMAVGFTFAQLFWETLRSHSCTVREIDALVKTGQSPFHPLAIRAAITSFVLFLVSCIASAMALIVIIAPGSLTVSSDFLRKESCTVPTVPDVMAAKYEDNDQLAASVTGILTSNTYLSPFRAIECEPGASACSYNISLVGPAFDCIDVSSQTNFTDLLHPKAFDPTVPFFIWDETSFDEDVENPNGLPVGVSVLTQDLVKGVAQANNCTTYNATYDIGVVFEGGSAAVHVWDVTLHSFVTYDNETNKFISIYAQEAINALAGPIYAGSSGYAQSATSQVQNAAFFVTTPTGNHTWSDNITHVLTSYMQNVSLSLLSGNINIGFSNETATNLLYVSSTCTSTFTVYVYNSTRLLSTYGVALGVALLTVIPGCWLILRNGIEEKLVLSHILQFALNEELLRFSEKLQDNIPLRLEQGKVLPQPSSFSADDAPYAAEKYVSGRAIWKDQLRTFTPEGVQMLALLLVGLCCMIFHHQYYHYLDGKTPSLSLRHSTSSTFLRNQTVVSDIGLALAYVAQTVFVAAIAIASAQLFWRSLRARGHTISQIDALMRAQVNPFTLSSFPAARASLSVLLLAILASAMSGVSIFAPSAIRVSFDRTLSGECTVKTLRNLTSVTTDSGASDYSTPIGTVLSVGAFIPPLNPCAAGDGVQCQYNLNFVGPGFDCEDVTASSDYAAFANWSPESGFNMTNVYNASLVTQPEDFKLHLSVQTWDMKRAQYQAVNCTGVSRSYSVTITHNSSTTIDVHDSSVLSPVLSQPGVDLSQAPGIGNISFSLDYLVGGMTMLVGSIGTNLQGKASTLDVENNLPPWMGGLPTYIGGLGSFLVDGNYMWKENMTVALEEYAQNLTLSVLSGQIFTFNNADDPTLLEDATIECNYTFTAYDYSPRLLVLTYGVAAAVTMLCVVGGLVAIQKNGVGETMDFSRFLRAVLNEQLYHAEESFELHTDLRIKADRTVEGTLVLVDSSN